MPYLHFSTNGGSHNTVLNRFFVALRSYGFPNQRGIPSLDGLRALSIGLVLLAHLTGTLNFPLKTSAFSRLGDIGEFGVRVFFVISGYLITSILQSEWQRSGRIKLSKFYLRRTLRLFPACYFLILTVAVLAHANLAHMNRGDFAFAAGYAMNFHEGRGWPLGHLWSLAVEEQFYLLWPFTLKSLGESRASRLLLALIAAVPFIRFLHPILGASLNFVIWSDTLATGCLLALWRDKLYRNPAYFRVLSSRWFFLIPALAFLANAVPSTKVRWLVGETVMNICIALTVDWCMRNAKSAVGRFLNWPFVSFVGVLSYSLYLWQQFFLDRASTNLWNAFPLNVTLAVLAAMFSYLVIEAPILRIRPAIERALSRRQDSQAEPVPLK